MFGAPTLLRRPEFHSLFSAPAEPLCLKNVSTGLQYLSCPRYPSLLFWLPLLRTRRAAATPPPSRAAGPCLMDFRFAALSAHTVRHAACTHRPTPCPAPVCRPP